MTLNTPVSELKSVGKTMEKRLAYLGIGTIEDLLLHYPFRYDDFSTVKMIASLVDGEETTVRGTISLIHAKRSPRKRMMITEAVVQDQTGQMKIVWFQQAYIAKQLSVGDQVSFFGKVSDSMYGLQMKNPQFEKIIQDQPAQDGKILPVYPTTAGITQKQLRYIISQGIDLADQIEDWVPEAFLDMADTIHLAEALRGIHQPSSLDHLDAAQYRMKCNEILLHQLRAEKIRQAITAGAAPSFAFDESYIKTFVASLPFALTKDQKIVSWQILQDLEKSVPMNRLLEGDVGSGKTVVAALTAAQVIHHGAQVAVMAPTSILADQHVVSFCELLPDHVIGLKTGSHIKLFGKEFTEKTKAGKKREFLSLLAEGAIDLVVGTHALITPDTKFSQLGYVIVDEQHRFGVAQRKQLKDQSGDAATSPHFLSMTATPIPRSYALALYGDLDVSIIKTLPAGRKPVITKLVQESQREEAYGLIRKELTAGRQAFVICPMIDAEGEQAEEKKTVLAEYERLSQEIFPEYAVGFVHGKMKAADKDAAMHAFAEGETQILVSTSVIEVGVNVPNASVMIIEDAERFGLAQLHQFRGRVGRSSYQSYCALFTNTQSESALDRLAFFADHTDGFAVAEYDLNQRGPGEVYGTTQSGQMNFRFASLADQEIIATVRSFVRDISFDAYPSIQKELAEWEAEIHLE